MAAFVSSKRMRGDHDMFEPNIKRLRGPSSSVCDDYVHDTNLKKRGPTSIFPQNRPNISSKKSRFRMSHSVTRSSEIKEIFAFYMPYGCRYNEERRIISYFNEYYDFIGTKDRFDLSLFEVSKTMIFYDKSMHPTEDVENMKNYISKLVQFTSYIQITPDKDRASGYTITDNLCFAKANHYRNLIFGSYNPFKRIDQHVY